MHMHTLKIVAGLIVVGAVGVLVYTPSKRHQTAPESSPMADLTARTLDGQPRQFADYKGQPLLLNVWATWCPPCVKEMPSIERAYQAFRAQGLRVIAISIDDAGAETDIRAFVREHGLTFEILHDATGRTIKQLNIRGVPETFLISRSGNIVTQRFAADWDAAENRALIQQLLGAD
jgi:peroxiredoxin